MSDEETTFKISMPLITEQEIKDIDNNFDEIVRQVTKQVVRDKELAIAQHIIQKQQEEIKRNKRLFSIQEKRKWRLLQQKDRKLENKDKTIDLMAEELYLNNALDCDYKEFKDNKCKTNESNKEICKECIKQYFAKKGRKKC